MPVCLVSTSGEALWLVPSVAFAAPKKAVGRQGRISNRRRTGWSEVRLFSADAGGV